MNNVSLIHNKKPTQFTGPSSWEDITVEQYEQFCRALDQHATNMEGRFALLTIWYNIPISLLKLLTDEQRLELVSLLDFLDEQPDRWMLPRLKMGPFSIDYVGPGDGLEFLIFSEFIFAEAAFQRCLAAEAKAIEPAASLTAALYRPFHTKGDGQRKPFESRLLSQQTTLASKLPSHILQGVVTNYQGCRERFPSHYPHLFKKTDTTSDDGGNWLDVGLSLVRQTGALGTFAELERTNLFIALTTLDQIMKEQQQLEERLKKTS